MSGGITVEPLRSDTVDELRRIRREDISEDFVDGADTILWLNRYGVEHNLVGRTYLIRLDSRCVGMLLIGDALEWDTDPAEMRGVPFYRLMGFVIDREYRGRGIGGRALEAAIAACYAEFGVRPIALGCHRDNVDAARFYERHGFRRVDAVEGNDQYYLRCPKDTDPRS